MVADGDPGAGGLGIGGLGLVISRLRRDSRDLEQRVFERTADLIQVTQVLEKEYSERKAAEDKFKRLLEAAPDSTVIVNGKGEIVLVNAQREKVLLNLIINTAHAIRDAGSQDDGKKGILTLRTRASGDWAEIHIEDTGTGISEEAQGKIFDPFFTTKDVGEGTGQGLTIAHDVVVNKHGGTLTFDTAIGKGTTFLVRLPLRAPYVHAESPR